MARAKKTAEEVPAEALVVAPVVPVEEPKKEANRFSGAGKQEGLRNIFIHVVKGEFKYSQKYEHVAQSILEGQVMLEKAVEPFEVPDHTHQAWYSAKLHGLRDRIVAFNKAREVLLAAHLDILQGLEDPGSCSRSAAPYQDEV